MEIYLIRHTTPAVEKGTCYGQADVLLANTFLEEANKVKNNLTSIAFDAVYSSPLHRCATLATTLNLSEVIYFDERLKELNFGLWELKKWDNIPLEESKYWMDDFVNEAPPQGESYTNLQSRAVTFYKELLKKKHKKIAIITHAGVIRALISYVNSISLKNSFTIKVPYGAVLKL